MVFNDVVLTNERQTKSSKAESAPNFFASLLMCNIFSLYIFGILHSWCSAYYCSSPSHVCVAAPSTDHRKNRYHEVTVPLLLHLCRPPGSEGPHFRAPHSNGCTGNVRITGYCKFASCVFLSLKTMHKKKKMNSILYDNRFILEEKPIGYHVVKWWWWKIWWQHSCAPSVFNNQTYWRAMLVINVTCFNVFLFRM